MLVYHPAFDIYNCAFRMLQLLSLMEETEIELDKLRIWDFYLTFPNEARQITFPRDLFELKKIFKNKPDNPYEDLIDPKRIAERMNPYQLSALRYLASYGLIDNSLFQKNIVKRTDKELPSELKQQLSEINTEKENIIKLVKGFNFLALRGLKERTGLLEFRYDRK
ncbi:ABC-three component system middle component 5 [Mesoflavibacter zeaxanthinifaciens]|uniref:ABC-three component system middle component 5 n=1 Tax=Mesoflavibacter zeaxanthinifaciens TaxID=393060 RepID=UPI003A947B58